MSRLARGVPAWSVALVLGACASEPTLVAPPRPDATPPAFTVTAPDARVEVRARPGLAIARTLLEPWVAGAVEGIVHYFGRFPVPSLTLELRPSARRSGVAFGMAYGGRKPWIFVELGANVSARDLADDWVLVHELIHIAFPHLADHHRWAMEGMATWVEPFIRLRAGAITAPALWARFVERMPYGLPAPDDQGLDRTPTWGRTYWGGALFWLVAELEVRRATRSVHGLRTAFQAILAAGGDKRRMLSLEDTLALGDRALGVDVLVPLAATWRSAPVTVDLDALWARLGIGRAASGSIVLDDSAPDAKLRVAIERQAF